MNINKAIQSAFTQYRAGNLKQAEEQCRKILKKNANHFDALHLLGCTCYLLEEYDAASKYLQKALTINANNVEAMNNLGNVLQRKGQPDEALTCYKKALQINPGLAVTYNSIGIILKEKGQFDEAVSYYQKALQINPGLAEAYNNIGIILKEKGQPDEALTYFQKALQINPGLAVAYNNIGMIYKEKSRFEDAITCYQKALQIDPGLAEAFNNIGITFKEKGQLDQALTCYKKALQINPNFAVAYNNIGILLREKGQFDEAIACHQKALQISPGFAEAYINMGSAFIEKGEFDEAVLVCCKKALEINPDHIEAYSQLIYQLQKNCAWHELAAMSAKLDSLTRTTLDAGMKPSETPFMNITRSSYPPDNYAIAKSWSRDISIAMSSLNLHFSFNAKRTGKTKIIIGYFSNDFGNHATAHLMLSLFGLHNRDEFSIYCYSYGKDDGSSYRARIQRDCDKFVDISGCSDDAAAKRIYEDQVDILVDLKGYTRGNRLPISALRPAPVQVSYLGFPGTTGADFIDYIITDKIVTPENQSLFYSEKFVYMPHCYQVNDHTQAISEKAWKKTDFGLPENSFIFCSFNQPYKIDPILFDSWMRILQQVPESILWLGFANKIVEENLRLVAEKGGVQPQRLIFAGGLPKDEHLARLRLADLALDTRIVNGHTTTSDALWAGIPVITLQGCHFASRVSASILSALGLPQLITGCTEDYEALAVRLANNPAVLQQMRQKIAGYRLTAPLFDTPRYVKNLETAYKQMWTIYLAGEEPRQIEVTES